MSVVLVAKHARVSTATVSRVVNGDPKVTPQLAARVHDAMREVGYVPRAPEARRGPKPERIRTQAATSGNIALLTISMDPGVLQHVVSVEELAQSLGTHDLNLLIAPASDPRVLPSVIANRKVDGVILQGMEPVGEASTILRQLPVVWMMTRRSSTFWADYVQPDNWENGSLAASYLLERGHREFAIINPQPNYPAFRTRCHAFADAIADVGAHVAKLYDMNCEPDPVLRPHFSPELLKVVVSQVAGLLDMEKRPTALYVPCGTLANAIFAALERGGLRLGEHVEVVVGDYDPALGVGAGPYLAQIDVQVPTIAHRCVEQLVWRMNHRFDPGPVGISVSPRLVVGTAQP